MTGQRAAGLALVWDIAQGGAYASLVPVVYFLQPGLKTSVSLLVALSIATAAQDIRSSFSRWRGKASDRVDTTDDRLARIEAKLERLG